MVGVGRKIATVGAVMAVGVATLANTSAYASVAVLAKPGYSCIVHNHTALYVFGGVVDYADAGQGIYEIMDYNATFLSAKLWGDGSGVQYQIQRWDTGWCG